MKQRLGTWSAVAAAIGILAGCAQVNKAPVEDRTLNGVTSPYGAANPALPGAHNAGKPGYYTIRPGDTLIRIGLEHGQSWKDIARWSELPNPDVIEVGQVIRVLPPGTAAGESGPASTAAIAAATPVQATPLPPAASTPAPLPAAATVKPTSPPQTANPEPRPPDTSGTPGFGWPAAGPVIAGFNESTNKGLDIAGKAGDPVIAAADGRVVYAGTGLRGYGYLVILKHNNTYLTAYAHNQKLLVKEDQNVKKGQRIAEMGSSDTDRVKLHFEIRKQGKPVNPQHYLPPRP